MEGKWHRKSINGVVAIYIHGILSDGERCWRSEDGTYWPDIFISDPALSHIGVYVFTYKTGFFSGTYDLSDVVDALKTHMALDDVLTNKHVILICHSMGGIVARRYLVQQHVSIIEKGINIALFLIASPSLGAKYADWLRPIAKLFNHTQADVLRFVSNNFWLKELDKDFINMKEAGKFPLFGKELIEDNFIILSGLIRKQIVTPLAGARYFGEPYKIPNSNHFSISKINGPFSTQHRILVQFIQDFIELTGLDISQQNTAGRKSTKSALVGNSSPPPITPQYYCYVSKSKVDQLASELPQVLASDQAIVGKDQEASLVHSVRLPYGRPDMFQKDFATKKEYSEKLANILQSLIGSIKEFDWQESNDHSFFHFIGDFLVSSVDEAHQVASLTSSAPNRKLVLDCSLSNFSHLTIQGEKMAFQSTNYGFFVRGDTVNFETVFMLTSIRGVSFIGSPLYLKLPISKGLSL